MSEGVAISRAALEYFQEQHDQSPSDWSKGRLDMAKRSLASVEKCACQQLPSDVMFTDAPTAEDRGMISTHRPAP